MVSTIATGSSSRSINALSPATLEVTSPTGFSMAEGGLGATVSSSALATGYFSEVPTGALSVPIASSAEGSRGRDKGTGLRALSFSSSSHSPMRLENSPPRTYSRGPSTSPRYCKIFPSPRHRNHYGSPSCEEQ